MNRLLAVLLLLTGAAASERHGYIVGTVAAVGVNEQAVPCGSVALVVSIRRRTSTITADENGDFMLKMKPGRYELRELLGKKQRKLRLDSRQARDFVISQNRVKRFDVLVETCASEGWQHESIRDQPTN